MKKLAILMACLLIPSVLFAAEPTFSISSGEQSTTTLIHTGRSAITNVLVITDNGGANDAKVIVYCNTTASGTVIGEFGCPEEDMSCSFDFSFPIACEAGIYAVGSGTGATYTIHYIER